MTPANCFLVLLLAQAALAQALGAETASPTAAAASGAVAIPAPLAVPQPGSTNDAPYAPQPILPGGIVIPL